jgi:urease accessory protein
MRTSLTRAIVAAASILPTAAFAHTGLGDAHVHGFAHGFWHPLSGLDHVLAMVTVGIFAWQLGGRAIWLVPSTFILVMTAGGCLGMAGIPLPFAEIGIAASIVALGAIVALRVKAPVAVAMAIVGVFAIFHGYAHGAEMPAGAAAAAYAAGFMLATALLHVGGIAFGFLVGRIGESVGRHVCQVGGALVALAGVALLAATV